MDSEPRPFLDLGRARRVKGRGFQVRLSLAERIRAARGVPQAVVKVGKYIKGKAHLAYKLWYNSRDSKLVLETDRGEELTTPEDRRMLADDWAMDFDGRADSRDAANLVFSMPKGSDPEALRAATRAALTRLFPDNEWVFAVHTDRGHPHAHALVKMRGRDAKKKLRLDKPELYQMREVFAETAREQGVQLAASPRAARGVGRKAERQGIYHMREKKIPLNVDRDVEREAAREVGRGRPLPQPWEKSMAARHLLERATYERYAQHLRSKANGASAEERDRWLRAAADMERFLREMPKPKTRRQELMEKSKRKNPLREGGKERGAGGLDLER